MYTTAFGQSFAHIKMLSHWNFCYAMYDDIKIKSVESTIVPVAGTHTAWVTKTHVCICGNGFCSISHDSQGLEGKHTQLPRANTRLQPRKIALHIPFTTLLRCSRPIKTNRYLITRIKQLSSSFKECTNYTLDSIL